MKKIFKFLAIILLIGTTHITQTSETSSKPEKSIFAWFKICRPHQDARDQNTDNSNRLIYDTTPEIIVPSITTFDAEPFDVKRSVENITAIKQITPTRFEVKHVNARGDVTYKIYKKVVRPEKRPEEKNEDMRKLIKLVDNYGRYGLSPEDRRIYDTEL